jgi:hypothetical protein
LGEPRTKDSAVHVMAWPKSRRIGIEVPHEGFEDSTQVGSVAKIYLGKEGREKLYAYAATPKRPSTNLACPVESLPSNLFTCPFLIMCMASTPYSVGSAVWKERKHCIALHLLRIAQ